MPQPFGYEDQIALENTLAQEFKRAIRVQETHVLNWLSQTFKDSPRLPEWRQELQARLQVVWNCLGSSRAGRGVESPSQHRRGPHREDLGTLVVEGGKVALLQSGSGGVAPDPDSQEGPESPEGRADDS